MLMYNAIVACLALNIYFEARNQSFEGQVAVSQVVFNRVADHRYPDNVCDVVYQAERNNQGKVIRNRCQFSWFCDGKSDIPKDRDAFRWASVVARTILDLGDTMPDYVNGATHYHTTAINPKWKISKEQTAVIEDHVFFRWLPEVKL
mgnify:FL=1|tara:strand:- start:68 stop:508 length:441 start_codon:yes stop_codon:yes gene_type:complete